MTARYLADKSAHTAAQHASSTRLMELMGEGLVASCAIVNLELLYSARSRRDYEEARSELLDAFEEAPVDHRVTMRALEVQRSLAAAGKHRTAGVPDLLIASAAELAGLTLLHCDRDLEVIAQVTGQPHETIGRPPASSDRPSPYVVLVGKGTRFDLAGQVDAISPQDAVAEAVQHGLVDPMEARVVAVSTRHWRPEAASDCIGSDS